MAEKLTDSRLAALEKLAAQPKSLLSGDQLLNVLQHEVPLLVTEVRRLRRRLDVEGGDDPAAGEDVAALKKAFLVSAADYAGLFNLMVSGLQDQMRKYEGWMVKRLEEDRKRFGGGT